MLLLPSSMGRGGWVTHPASPSFLWKEVARSAGGWLRSFRLRPTPALRASPFHGKEVDGLFIPLFPPSSGRRWHVASEVGFALFRFQPTPVLRASPFHGKGGGLLTPLLPPSSGRRWRVAPEVGFALFRLRPTSALRASLFHGKGVDGLLIPLLPPLEGGGAERRRLASLSFAFGPPPFGRPPSMGRG